MEVREREEQGRTMDQKRNSIWVFFQMSMRNQGLEIIIKPDIVCRSWIRNLEEYETNLIEIKAEKK
jgi:hypothetical protein